MVWIIFGEPKPFSAQSVARIRIRSINGFLRKLSGSTSGKYGLDNAIGVAPLRAAFDRNIRSRARHETGADRRRCARALSSKDNVVLGLAPAIHLPPWAARSTVRSVVKAQIDPGVEGSRPVAETAERLHNRLAELASLMHRSLENQIPELPDDERLTELLGASVEGNVDTILRALRYDIAVERVEAPTAALEYARRLAQHGVPVNALVRAYRLGQRVMNELVFAEVRALDISEQLRYAVIEAITATLFEYIDWISQQVVVAYEDERERWLENQNSLRALRVREVLAATKTIDVDATSTSIRYPLRGHHLGLLLWYPDASTEGNELARLQRFLRELGEAAGAAEGALFAAADRTCGWGWLPYRASNADAAAKVRQFTLSRPDSPSVAIGTV